MKIKSINKFYPALFWFFAVVVLTAYLWYRPGWGFMDDQNNLSIAQEFWQKGDLGDVLKHDQGYGRFRPLYCFWVIAVYHLLAASPLSIYILVFFVSLGTLYLWGKMINKVFETGAEDPFALWIYPLSFFAFTPFWNLFMYISVQEKFVFWFGSAALYLFIRLYETQRMAYAIGVFAATALAVMGKETGISLIALFALYGFLDFCFFRENKKLSGIVWLVGTLVFVGYYFFIKSFMGGGGYPTLYKNNFQPLTVIANLWGTSTVLRGLVIFSIVWSAWFMWLKGVVKGTRIKNQAILFPMFLFLYLLILSPWKFVNYLLAPLAPMVMVMTYPVYGFLKERDVRLKYLLQVAVAGLSFMVAFGIIIPRISKMTDKRKVIEFLRESEHQTAAYFFSQPFEETAGHLSYYAGITVHYLGDGQLTRDKLAADKDNYLIFNDETMPVSFIGVEPGPAVYQSNTWVVVPVKISARDSERFSVDFPRTFLEVWKDKLKKI